MQSEYLIPLIIAVIAFLTADDESQFLNSIAKKSYLIPSGDSVRARLSELGRNSEEDYENFRISQLSYMAVAIISLTMLYLLLAIGSFLYFALLLISASSSLIISERNLSRKCRRKRREIDDEFPVIIEMLTLSVGAGESPAIALSRIAQRADGHLAREFRELVREIELGVPFTSALDAMSHRVNSENLRRFVDSIIISALRGTPLVETLAHSANEARNRERVALMAAAGKSEISMMIPVVFLILPISILFALFPSLSNLNLFTS